MFSLLGQQKFWRHGCQISKRLYANRLSPQHVQQIAQKEDENQRGAAEPAAIVMAHSLRSPKPMVVLCPNVSHTVSGVVVDDLVKNTKRKEPDPEWTVTPCQDMSKLGKHYLMLSKARLTSLVVITSMAGYAMAPAPFEFSTFVLCAVGTGLCSAAANSINQYHEVPFDAQMSRTKNRVLVKGLVTPLHAIGFAIGAGTTGICMLYYGVNGMTAALGAGNLFLYTMIYTPMKRYSILNTWVGSFVGAIPPLMGWVGCAGTFDAGAWILAGLLYAWQFPHFNALSWNLRPDYSRAGYRMMSVTNPALCRRVALRYTAILAALSLAAPYFDVTNIWFALETLPLNGYFMYLAYKFYKNSDSNSSRKLFRFSLIHLPLLMILFLVNKKRWIFTEDTATQLKAASGLAGAAVVVSGLPIESTLPLTVAVETSSTNATESQNELPPLSPELEALAIKTLQTLWR